MLPLLAQRVVVDLRHEYTSVTINSAEEMEELKEWRNSPKGKSSMEESRCRYKSGGGNKGGSGGKVHFIDKAIAAA
eukprot:14720384-Ditylum_brightwellii.AAC.1